MVEEKVRPRIKIAGNVTVEADEVISRLPVVVEGRTVILRGHLAGGEYTVRAETDGEPTDGLSVGVFNLKDSTTFFLPDGARNDRSKVVFQHTPKQG